MTTFLILQGEEIMSKRNVSIFTLLIVCGFFLSCIIPGVVSGKESSLEERIKNLEKTIETLQKEVTLAKDVQEIANLQARYCAIHNTDEKLSWSLFADRPDTTKEITHTRLVGFDNIKKAYLEGEGAVLESDNLPEGTIIGVTTFPEGSMPPTGITGSMGDHLRIHPIGTPCIVVAGDGKTAKATFTSLGFEGTGWCYGMYANDYIKIDGKWYIWHMKWLRCFKTEWNKSFAEQTLDEIYPRQEG